VTYGNRWEPRPHKRNPERGATNSPTTLRWTNRPLPNVPGAPSEYTLLYTWDALDQLRSVTVKEIPGQAPTYSPYRVEWPISKKQADAFGRRATEDHVTTETGALLAQKTSILPTNPRTWKQNPEDKARKARA
jgi:hypothetical protein